MKLLDKVKNLFTEEIEEEVPIRKEVKKVEIAQPKVEQPKMEIPRVREEIEVKKEEAPQISESSALNKEEKFKFPVYFDDKDFEDLPKAKELSKEPSVAKIERAYQGTNPAPVEPKKRFRVSPVISPVYGVLDKNYNKDDIKIKSEKTTKRIHIEDKITIDDIRNKAYGTLEDDLENSLLTKTIAKEQPKPVEPGIDIFEEIENTDTTSNNNDLLMQDITFDKEKVVTVEEATKEVNASLEEELEKQKKKIEELNDYIHTIQNEAEIFQPNVEEEPNIIEEVVKEEKEQTTESAPEEKSDEQKEEAVDEGDLFSLIDSMYEKRDE